MGNKFSELKTEGKNCRVQNVKKFRARGGYGLDVDIVAETKLGTTYLQVVLYDEQALYTYGKVNVGDIVNVTGNIRVKPYQKADGTAAVSLTIERPELFDKHMQFGRIEPLLPYQPAEYATAVTDETETRPQEKDFWEIIEETSAQNTTVVTAAEPAEEKPVEAVSVNEGTNEYEDCVEENNSIPKPQHGIRMAEPSDFDELPF